MRALPRIVIRQPELWGFACLLMLCNVHLLSGSVPGGFGLCPDAPTLSWLIRVLVHPFVHVSWYHLFLDAGAFFLLYSGLMQQRACMRLFYLGACAVGSLSLCLVLSPDVRANGLCGLSGVAHGLMAIAALEMLTGKDRWLGTVCLALVMTKSVFEVLGNEVLFTSLHFGQIGNAIPAAHLGGVLGGIAAFAASAVFRKYANTVPSHGRVLACEIRGRA